VNTPNGRYALPSGPVHVRSRTLSGSRVRETAVTPDEMLAVYRRHRAAEDARDFWPSCRRWPRTVSWSRCRLACAVKARTTRPAPTRNGRSVPRSRPDPRGHRAWRRRARRIWTIARDHEGSVARPLSNRTRVHGSARQHRPLQGRPHARRACSVRRCHVSPNRLAWTCTNFARQHRARECSPRRLRAPTGR
jgi:hypothetical protein